jgi:hypothetical protein
MSELISLKKLCKEILQFKSLNEEKAYKQLEQLLINYNKEYTCNGEFYLYHNDAKNNYKLFREKTEIIFELLHNMFFDEEIINDVSKDALKDESVKNEVVKYFKFLESIQFIKKHIRNISFENKNSVEVSCFHKYMNYSKKYLEGVYQGMEEMNNVFDELNNNLDKLEKSLVNIKNRK